MYALLNQPGHKDSLGQGFSESTFKGPNLNFHQWQRSAPEKMVITKFVFNKHMHSKSKLFNFHSKCINNKCKSVNTINLSVSIRGRLIWIFLVIDGQYMMQIFWADMFDLFDPFIS